MRLVPVLAAAVSAIALATVSGSAFGAESAFRKAVFARGFDAPVLLTYAPRRAWNGLRRGAAGARDPPAGGAANACSWTFANSVEYGGEQGLLGLAFDPGYANEPQVLRRDTRLRSGRNTVERFRSATARRPSRRAEELLLAVQDPYGNHNGGHLAFGPDGRLYTSIGDGGSGGDPGEQIPEHAVPVREAAGARRLEAPRAVGRSRRSGFEIPGGSRSIARPAISTSATSARVRSRK